jgi:hypothetical protein
MSRVRRYICLVSALALLLTGCELQDFGRLLSSGDGDRLPLAPLGGIPIRMVAQLETDYRDSVEGAEIQSWSLAWTHTAEGLLSTTLAWSPHLEEFSQGRAYGRDHCYSPCGAEHDLTFNWDSHLPFDDRKGTPEFHIRIYGDEALVLYGPGEVAYLRPKMPECACLPDWTSPAGWDHLDFSTDYPDADRAPDAGDSLLTIVQSGVVLLRIPIADLRKGTSTNTTADLEDIQDGTGGFRFEHRLRITLDLTSG